MYSAWLSFINAQNCSYFSLAEVLKIKAMFSSMNITRLVHLIGVVVVVVLLSGKCG